MEGVGSKKGSKKHIIMFLILTVFKREVSNNNNILFKIIWSAWKIPITVWSVCCFVLGI